MFSLYICRELILIPSCIYQKNLFFSQALLNFHFSNLQNEEESFPLNSMLEEDMDLESDDDDDNGDSNGNTYQSLCVLNLDE